MFKLFCCVESEHDVTVLFAIGDRSAKVLDRVEVCSIDSVARVRLEGGGPRKQEQGLHIPYLFTAFPFFLKKKKKKSEGEKRREEKRKGKRGEERERRGKGEEKRGEKGEKEEGGDKERKRRQGEERRKFLGLISTHGHFWHIKIKKPTTR